MQELKASVEEYEQHCRTELEDEGAKLEADKHAFSVERIQILTDGPPWTRRGQGGPALATLDERESKLRHLLGTLKEQQDQWQRAVSDLRGGGPRRGVAAYPRREGGEAGRHHRLTQRDFRAVDKARETDSRRRIRIFKAVSGAQEESKGCRWH